MVGKLPVAGFDPREAKRLAENLDAARKADEAKPKKRKPRKKKATT